MVNGCYAAPLHDCDGGITGDHLISDCVLKVYAPSKKGKVTRPMHGLFQKEIGLDAAMKVNVLCERHNGALSAIDVAACRFAKELRSIPHFMNADGEGVHVAAFAGEDLELWLLKAACAWTCMERREVPYEWVRILFGETSMPFPLGLRFVRAFGVQVPPEWDDQFLGIETLHNADTGQLESFVVELGDFALMLALVKRDIFPTQRSGELPFAIRRPRGVHYTGDRRQVLHEITWSTSPHGEVIRAEWSKGTLITSPVKPTPTLPRS